MNFDFYYKISFQKTNLNKLIVIFHQLTIQFQFKFFLSSSSRFNPFINQLSPSSHFLINHVCFISMHCLYHQSIQNQPLHIVIAFIVVHQHSLTFFHFTSNPHSCSLHQVHSINHLCNITHNVFCGLCVVFNNQSCVFVVFSLCHIWNTWNTKTTICVIVVQFTHFSSPN